MAYVKTNWVNGLTPVNSTNLNKIENGIEANDLLKAPLASPVFTGTPTAPTAPIVNSSLQLATTQFVKNGMSDISEYPVATVVSRQIRVVKNNASKTTRFQLTSNISLGTVISVSLDGGATSKPLKDIENADLLELDKGFYEVIADATFFTLRPSGGKKLIGDNVAVASSVSGTTLKLTPPKGCFDGVVGNNVTITDADFVPENIRESVNLFGKVGTLVVVNATPSANIKAQSDGINFHSGSALSNKKREIRVEVSGTIRVSFELFCDVSDIIGRLYKNGTQVASSTQTLNQWNIYTHDIPVVKSDLIQLYMQGGVASSEGQSRNFRVGYEYISPNSTVLL